MNNLHMCYKSTAGILGMARATSIFVAGRDNRLDPVFQEVRPCGSELLGYFNTIETPNGRASALSEEWYMGDYTRVPRWLGPDGQPRVNWPTSQMLDIRPGSPWVEHVVGYLGQRMEDGLLDGFFLDVIGTRPWDTNWSQWPPRERVQWQQSAVALVRRLDEERRRRNPDFIIVTNNHWNNLHEGERHINGICIEGHEPDSFHAAKAARTFSDLGHRRVLTLNSLPVAATRWLSVPGVTHVGHTDKELDGDADGYGVAAPGLVKVTTDLGRLERGEQVAVLRAEIANRTDQLRAMTEARDSLADQLRQADAKLLAAKAKAQELAGLL